MLFPREDFLPLSTFFSCLCVSLNFQVQPRSLRNLGITFESFRPINLSIHSNKLRRKGKHIPQHSYPNAPRFIQFRRVFGHIFLEWHALNGGTSLSLTCGVRHEINPISNTVGEGSSTLANCWDIIMWHLALFKKTLTRNIKELYLLSTGFLPLHNNFIFLKYYLVIIPSYYLTVVIGPKSKCD